jgi:hypothetical protein
MALDNRRMRLSPWKRLLLAAGAFLLLVYLGDYISIVYRIPNGREQFGSVDVQKLLAVPQKDRKTEYIADPPQPEQCVHSLFPRLGLTPCWYLERHAVQQINY